MAAPTQKVGKATQEFITSADVALNDLEKLKKDVNDMVAKYTTAMSSRSPEAEQLKTKFAQVLTISSTVYAEINSKMIAALVSPQSMNAQPQQVVQQPTPQPQPVTPQPQQVITATKISNKIVPIIVNYSGSNRVFIRGQGGNLSWEKGIELQQANGKYVLQLPNTTPIKFKLILNDDPNQWEDGADRIVPEGQSEEVKLTPKFPNDTSSRIGAGGSRRADEIERKESAVTVQNRVVNEEFSF